MSGPTGPAPAPTGSQTPKGILKKPKSTPGITAPPPSESTPLPLEQQIAIQQAKLLLQQRGEEIKPPVSLDVFERLSQFPVARSDSFSAANPSPEDVHEFIEAIQEFMPREYQDLIEERNCLGNCGYALCPRPRRKYNGEFRILSSGIAKVADLNMWCSDDCARRALFIKVQLDNPSYIKKDGQLVVKIELDDEKKHPSRRQPPKIGDAEVDESELAKSMERLEVDKKTQTTRDKTALAVERGDARRPAQQVEVTIREKSTTAPAQAPDLDQAAQDVDAHLMLEGHKTTFGTDKDDDGSGSDDDDYLPSAIRL
ncbi:Rtr1/RPAP2 family-domain-containing protein [Cercophora newfieldiana]|uniref:RNA polymerase II subunit B1 CTD phosphatase RPAP2 homolog n=1 Tax=Cercophora newfieldiana TaxID=92897 RepID=A0AA39XZT6_9PEZI|nr:Rtr1/RPAP2 family-domain-containing protein [Cercophora newfieldiana]